MIIFALLAAWIGAAFFGAPFPYTLLEMSGELSRELKLEIFYHVDLELELSLELSLEVHRDLELAREVHRDLELAREVHRDLELAREVHRDLELALNQVIKVTKRKKAPLPPLRGVGGLATI
jgi:hypothetical protein